MSTEVKPASFDAGELALKYAALDALPEALYQAVITHSGGDLHARVGAVLTWREGLLRGALPEPLPTGWPPAELAPVFSELLSSTRLLHFAKGEEEIADAVLLDLLNLVDRTESWKAEVFEDVFRQLMEAERVRREREREAQPRRNRTDGRKPVDEFNVPMARLAAQKAAQDKTHELLVQAFRSTWDGRIAAWSAAEEMFGPLSNLLGLGWDLSRGILRSNGWLAAEKLRALLARLPELKRVIEALGRMAVPPSSDTKSLFEEVIGPLKRPIAIEEPRRSPDVPIEMRGVERSGAIDRMLPSEAAMLTHPVLKIVWHARRAERALLTYEADGLEYRTTLVERSAEGPGLRPRPAEQKGPMILCIDTSGSMAGAPETVAKAIALEALRAAHTEKRRMFVYLFSGPGDVEEREISVSKQGIGSLLDFLASSFHGGTDVAGPLRSALLRIEKDDWAHADILLISDGEFPQDGDLFASVEAARGLRHVRVHGLLVASDRSSAMERLCTPLRRFSEWRALLGER